MLGTHNARLSMLANRITRQPYRALGEIRRIYSERDETSMILFNLMTERTRRALYDNTRSEGTAQADGQRYN